MHHYFGDNPSFRVEARSAPGDNSSFRVEAGIAPMFWCKFVLEGGGYNFTPKTKPKGCYLYVEATLSQQVSFLGQKYHKLAGL